MAIAKKNRLSNVTWFGSVFEKNATKTAASGRARTREDEVVLFLVSLESRPASSSGPQTSAKSRSSSASDIARVGADRVRQVLVADALCSPSRYAPRTSDGGSWRPSSSACPARSRARRRHGARPFPRSSRRSPGSRRGRRRLVGVRVCGGLLASASAMAFSKPAFRSEETSDSKLGSVARSSSDFDSAAQLRWCQRNVMSPASPNAFSVSPAKAQLALGDGLPARRGSPRVRTSLLRSCEPSHIAPSFFELTFRALLIEPPRRF